MKISKNGFRAGLLGAAAVATLAFSGGAAHANLIIDDMSVGTNQSAVITRDTGFNTTNSASTAECGLSTAHVIGGCRELVIGYFANPSAGANNIDTQASVSYSSGNGYSAESNGDAANAWAILRYDGDGAPAMNSMVNPTGLGGVDLSAFSAISLVGTSDGGMLNNTAFLVRLSSDSGHTSELYLTQTGSFTDQTFTFNLADFDTCDNIGVTGPGNSGSLCAGNALADLSNIGAIEVFTNGLSSSAIDLHVSFVQAVPEPMSLALLGTGLFGLGVIRRRQRAAKKAA